MFKHCKGFNKHSLKCPGRPRLGSEHEDCYEAQKKLVRNSEYSKSDNFNKLSWSANS